MLQDGTIEANFPNGTIGNPNPADGPEGGFTFLTDQRAFEDIVGNLPEEGGTLRVTADQLDELHWSLGLDNRTELGNGSAIRQFDGVNDLNPASPLHGNTRFRGPGMHLPGGGPEVVVNPAQSREGNDSIVHEWLTK